MSDETAAQMSFECPDCHGLVEMPLPAAAEQLQCPHCGYVIQRPSPKSSAKRMLVLTTVIVCLGAVGFGVAFALKHLVPPKEKLPAIAAPTVPSISANQFTISSVRLEKEGALRYVQGTASNGLAQQRFGVKIHLELLDTNELRVGSASDYRPVVQPNEVWQFRALVVEPGAVSAAVAGVQEEQ
jgi:hypothetical protein